MTDKETDDRWYVQFDSAEVRLMTLDEIQEAFEAGLIHENTYLIEVGKTNWQTLADVAGLGGEEEDPSEAEATPMPVAPAPQPAYIQQQQQLPPPHQHHRPEQAPLASARPPAGVSAYPQAAARVADSAWPPVIAAARPGTISSPPVARTGPQSTIPVVQDVGFDLDVDPSSFKSGKRNLFLFAAAAAAMIGGGGYAITRLDMPETPTAAAAPLAAPAMPTAAQPSAPPPPSPAVNTASAPPSSPASDTKTESAGSSGNLSEDMKRALLAQDKERSVKKKSRAAAGSKRRSKSSSSSGTVLKGGGGADDPLDPSL